MITDQRQAQTQNDDDQLETEWREKIQRALRDLRAMSSGGSEAKTS